MAIIGSVGVRVTPSFAGMGSAVSSAFGSAGRDAARAISTPVSTSLRDAVRSSVTAGSTAALNRVETATAGVTRAEGALKKAKDDSARASANAEVAQEKLNRLRNSGKASSGELAAAEADLSAAKSRAESAAGALSTAETNLSTAKSDAASATANYETQLARESTALHKVTTALPVVGERFKQVGGNISAFGTQVSGVGASLTRSVTAPALGAAGAVGGLVATLGFQRLVGLDSAQAKLRGLGYDAESVDRISQQVTDSIEGTMVTMAEGVDIAAGALAAGVDEGEDLERYIRLVGDAAIASGRPIEEMSMIFNRVQGSGKLMTQELNMLEQSVPGVTAALADSYGVAQDELREMVTNGEVDAEHFREVMDDFMGGMGEAYSDSFAGMSKNILAYLGIVGEEMLSGAFPKIKESMAEFIEFLQTDAVMDFAAKMGDYIGNAFETVIGWITSAIDWWTNLDGSTQKLILTIAGIAIALGPVLLIIGKVITFIGGVVTALGSIIAAAGPTIAVIGKVAGMFSFLLNPITWIVAGIAALVAGLVWFFTQTQIGQTIVSTAWSWIQSAISAVVNWATQTAWPMLQAVWEGISAGAVWLWEIMVSVWDWIRGAISNVVNWLTGTAWPMIQAVWDGIVFGAQWLWGILEPIFIMIAAIFLYVGQTLWNIYSTLIKTMWDAFVAIVRWVWNSILNPIFNFIVNAFRALGNAFRWVWNNIIKPMWDTFVRVLQWVWNSIVRPTFNFIQNAFRALGNAFRAIYNSIIKPMFDFFGAIIRWLWNNVARPIFNYISRTWRNMSNLLRAAWQNIIRPMINAFGNFIRNLWTNWISPALRNIRGGWNRLSSILRSVWRNYIRPVFRAVGNFVRNDLVDMIDKGVDKIKSVWDTVAGFFRKPINWVINTVWNNGLRKAYNTVADLINADKLGRVSSIGKVPGFAKGGYHKGGWAMVGEEGPELIYTDTGARVLTNRQTQEVIARNESGEPTEAETDLFLGRKAQTDAGIGNWFTRGAKWVADKTGISTAVDWVRGKLADGFRAAMKPIKNLVGEITSDFGTMGELSGNFLDWGIDGVADWIDVKDQEQFSDGSYDGPFTANPGGFNRPMQGPITSKAGARSYYGAFGNMHYGVDIGNSIGSAVRAAWSGVVRSTGGGGLDRIIVLNHGGFDTAYMHNSAILKSPGQSVTGGDQIARSGTAGSGPHLHFEYHPGGYYNPSVTGVNALFRDKGGLIPEGVSMLQNNTGGFEYAVNQSQFDSLMEMAEELSGSRGKGSPEVQQINYRMTSEYSAGQDLKHMMRGRKRKLG